MLDVSEDMKRRLGSEGGFGITKKPKKTNGKQT